MTIKELTAKLQQFPPETPVVSWDVSQVNVGTKIELALIKGRGFELPKGVKHLMIAGKVEEIKVDVEYLV